MRHFPIAVFLCSAALAQTYRGQIGIELENPSEGSRSRAFVDLGRVFRPWAPVPGNGTVPLDANGWPLSDASTVMFDVRPIPAWAPPIDDPQQFQPDWSGAYALSFLGQASVGTGNPSIAVAALHWDPKTNITTGTINVAKGQGLLTLSFTNTKRTANAPANSGIANLKLIRPGYAGSDGQVYSNEFLDSLAPFSVLRFLEFTAADDIDSAPYPAATNWPGRHVVSDATQQETGGKIGFAWEYAILLANQAGKDMWINIPVSATEDYIQQLAQLLKARLNPGLKIYIEHSNEVWNPVFPQYAWNTAAAAAEGLPGNLQRHMNRLATINRIFGAVFGADAINQRIRLVFAWWTPQAEEYSAGLTWMQDHLGTPSRLLYGVAGKHYFTDRKTPPNADPAGVLAGMRADSDDKAGATLELAAIAAKYGLQPMIYEGGPDNGGGSTTNVGNRILANRRPDMQSAVTHDIQDNWFAAGGNLYMYFALSGASSRYGCWGATEDIVNLNTPKYKALLQLIGVPAQPPAVTSIRNATNGTTEVASNASFTIYGTNFTLLTAQWGGATLDGVTLPTALAGVRVRINNRDAYIAYVTPTQINAVAPPDAATGPVPVQVITANGTVTTTITMTGGTAGIKTTSPARIASRSTELATAR